MKTFTSDLNNKTYQVSDRISAKSVRQSIIDIILKDHPIFERHVPVNRGIK